MIWTTLIGLLFLATSKSMDVTSYINHLPKELQSSVEKALNLEKTFTFNRNSPLSCQPRETSISCPPNKFRKPTGECNNIRHSQWGVRGTPFLRVLKPQYQDGVSKPRVSSIFDSSPLPSAEEVSYILRQSFSKQHESVTALLGAWSELLLHDLASTGNLRSIDCCSSKKHEECFTMTGSSCQEYVRSLPTIDDCTATFSHRNQMNLASSFLDASAIYGNDDESMQRLRTYDAGLVNVSACAVCKANALYSAILREHNRVAINLAQMNRHWDDEILFLESRRIVAAEIQHITYNEFLPIVLDETSLQDPGLKLKSIGHYSDYSSSNRAGVFNEVAMSALPAMISMIPASLMNETAENFAEMIDILIKTPAQYVSGHIEVPLRHGWDTTTLMVHMGRDHGLPGYIYYAKFARNISEREKIEFDELKRFGIDQNGINFLKKSYSFVEDIDLLAGGLLEKPLPGAAVGKTFSHLLEAQFKLLRRSDRFWYENDLPPSSLTSEQLTEIRKVTVASLLCANTDDLDKIQPKAFLQEDIYLNARISCEQHPILQLTPWLEMDRVADLSEEMLMDALAKAEQEVLQRRKQEYEAWSRFGGVDPKSPSGTAASFSKANKQALKLANSSLLFEFASQEIINSLSNRRRKRQTFDNILQTSDFTDTLQSVDLSSFLDSNSFSDPVCEDTGPCDETSPFRTFSGHCNNLRNPAYGKSLTTFARLLPSAYEDGISKPRVTGVTGIPLPSPRVISTYIHPDISNLHSRYTLMTMQFAQFLDHDLTMTPIHKGFHESIPDCRSCDSPRTVHPECNPIPIPKGDHYYPDRNVSTGGDMCFPFMRSLPGQQTLGPRQQVNQNTAFLDASQIYGENHCVATELKGNGGRMNCTIHPIQGKDLLPQSDHHPECKSGSGLCFIAGDGRASEQPALTAIHTVFMREHNRLVDELRKINPHWNEETLFEHARRIVVAENQHITYNEFLPRILSWNAVNLYGLKLLPQGYYTEYNPTCNPGIFSEFAAAAFRIGHSLLRPHIPRLDENYQILNPPILLRDGFFKVDMIMKPLMVDEISRGLVSTPMESLDQFITGEVTNHLFEDRKIPFSGIDLIALNVQRARDHGIPSYNNYRALCNLKRATSFDDLAREIPGEVIARLKKIYASVDDIDLFPGGMSERPLKGGLVGPTFACIIATQFRQLRKCDRFWYENVDPNVRFTENQLAELRKISLAKVICDNLDISSDIQRSAFDLPSHFLNPRVGCTSLPGIDLSAWRQRSSGGCTLKDRQLRIGESAFPSPCTSCICGDDGMQCASLRVTDCGQLIKEWPRNIILQDDVCTAQCGYYLRDAPFVNIKATGFSQLRPSPSRNIRSRTVIQSFDAGNPFQGFKLPDLTQFIV
nr:uncharacterized protein LOC111426494 [Onthophagus taurus]